MAWQLCLALFMGGHNCLAWGLALAGPPPGLGVSYNMPLLHVRCLDEQVGLSVVFLCGLNWFLGEKWVLGASI